MGIFKAGDQVRVKEDRIDGFKKDFQPKINRGRVGIVIPKSTSWGSGSHWVLFPKHGRRGEMHHLMMESELEIAKEVSSQ